MRIGIDYTAATHQQAGIGRYTRGLVRALAELDRRHEYVLFVTGGKGHGLEARTFDVRSEMPDNFQIRRAPLSDRLWAVVWHRMGIPLPVEVFTGSVDLFHSPDYLLPPLRVGRRVVTIHDLSFLRYPEGAEPSLRRYLIRAVPDAVRRANLVLADSQNTKRDVIELLEVAPDTVEVLYPGVDDKFRPVGNEQALDRVRDLYGLTFPFILSVGTLEPRKNLGLLIHAYGTLRKMGNLPHKLVVAGRKGWLYDGVFRKVDQLSLGDDVVYLGYVPDEDLPKLYNLAEVFVFPSLYEGFGLPPLEAMACGTPVITSESSSLPEVVGEAGLMVPADDRKALAEAMRELLSDRSLRDKLARRGVRQARKFTWQAAGQRVLAIYERLLDAS